MRGSRLLAIHNSSPVVRICPPWAIVGKRDNKLPTMLIKPRFGGVFVFARYCCDFEARRCGLTGSGGNLWRVWRRNLIRHCERQRSNPVDGYRERAMAISHPYGFPLAGLLRVRSQ